MLLFLILGALFLCGAVVLFVFLAWYRVKLVETDNQAFVFNQMMYLLGCIICLLFGIGMFGFATRIDEKE